VPDRPDPPDVPGLLKVEAVFVRSAASASDMPQDGLAELALVGRSNVGKSSLINALARRRVARTSGAPGKTRLANLYRVTRGSATPFYLVDLPGFGYARGERQELEAVTQAYFGTTADKGLSAALLLVDARHPGLESDVRAWRWLESIVDQAAIVATKIDKLSRAERLRVTTTNEAVFEHPVLPLSAATGEGLDELWKLIDRLLNSSNPRPRSSRQASPTAPEARRPRRPRRS
jgi:GTP-binding protein